MEADGPAIADFEVSAGLKWKKRPGTRWLEMTIDSGLGRGESCERGSGKPLIKTGRTLQSHFLTGTGR